MTLSENRPVQSGSRVPGEDARAQLIHSVYQIALEPQSYDVFMDHWDSHVSRALEELAALQDSADLDDQELLAHFNTAFGILEELGRRPQEPLRDGKGPRFLLDNKGVVIWRNRAAAEVLALAPRAGLEDLARHLHDPGLAQRMLADLAAASPGDPTANRLLRLDLDDGTLYLLARPIIDREGQKLILVEPLLGEWTPEMDQLLAGTFTLTEAETAVAAGLAEGLTPTELARRRGVSVLTVRTQIKALLAKTGAAGQTELVRLLMSVARVVNRTMEHADAPARPAICITARGSQIPVELFGTPGGYPVLFLHGMLDGCSATPRIEHALDRHGLRLIAPVRPGFGTALPDRGPIADAPRRFAEDIEGLVDRLRLKQFVLLGHMAGALYAFAVAARLGERVAGIVNVAGTVPILSNAQLATMSRRQRLVAYTAKYAPAALPFVLRAGIRQLDFNGERSFMSALYETSPRDLAMMQDPDVYRSLRRGYRFTVAQGHKAFETDGYHVVRDWSELAFASEAPVTLIHGRHDPVVNSRSVEEFASRLGSRARLVMMEDSGQLVLYRSPETVCAALAEHIGRADCSTIHEQTLRRG
jgi:pimeloyl-ACP methyl ester carboxylesterase/DNA-binding CsgD family transcriptional regulator